MIFALVLYSASSRPSTRRYHQMAGRSGRAGVSRGEEGAAAVGSTKTTCGESFLLLGVGFCYALAFSRHFDVDNR